ncbi:ferritin-like domain-containing protein [Cryobacterium arcticum]|uniref:Ferritin-like domain-containing protein n=1 Tax=Cryobacterium arcticum TaxID=670052 RepID=A0A317ZTK3_9MICO|nr:ferritin-like domain-containing protein [Cryobacterium arcticum]PXA68489.1 hypothetical protein CTB96_18020 [Cryobacterium arcticum]
MNQKEHPQTVEFEAWASYFTANLARHERLDALIPWDTPCALPHRDAAALARSLQRFELGEGGEGTGLLARARSRHDPAYDAALKLFIAEEQKHSALFLAALGHLGVEPLGSHWSDAAFVRLRRLVGLRTEITLFLIAETVAMEYFLALRRSDDPVVQGVARRILTDEVEHVRFQIDQLRAGFAGVPRPGRVVAASAAWVVAVGAATVLAIDHGPALRALGLRPSTFWRRALGHFGRSAPLAFRLSRRVAPVGPMAEPREHPLQPAGSGQRTVVRDCRG